MSLNKAFFITKIPYFIALVFIGTYVNYLFHHGFFITDLILWVGICIYLVLKPDIVCMLSKNDEYDVVSALPGYFMLLGPACLGLMIASYIGIVAVNFITGILITILMLLCFVIIDKSRYS